MLVYNSGVPAFYTSRGDDGFTGLLKEGRVPKSDPLLSALGVLDEANAALGLARSTAKNPESKEIILAVQRDLYLLMAEVSSSPENSDVFRKIDPDKIMWLESKIDTLSQTLEMPKEFIVPGDSYSAAVIDLARTVVRRAERQLVILTSRPVDLQSRFDPISQSSLQPLFCPGVGRDSVIGKLDPHLCT